MLGPTERRESDWLQFQEERTDAGFFGRGAATRWHLRLEEHEKTVNAAATGLAYELIVGRRNGWTG
jgi:hypothetical protein